jgi:hypothetical protein
MPCQLSSSGPAQQSRIRGTYPKGASAGRYFIVVRINGENSVAGEFTIPADSGGGSFTLALSLAAGTYLLGGDGSSEGDICVYSSKYRPESGVWSLVRIDEALTESLNLADRENQ